jgi:hypothetical protein
MEMPRGVRALVATLLLVVVSVAARAQQPEAIRIEKLVADGWDVAGFIAVADNRSVILFKHKQHPYLVQCSVLVDVMRNPRVVTYCYEIR